MDAAKIEAARKEGYSDKEIADFLAASNPRIQAARAEGYSDKEILGYFAPRNPSKELMTKVGDLADGAYGVARTIGNQALAGVASIPRMALEGIDWLGKKDAEMGGTGARVPEAVKNALPSYQEAKDALNKPHMPYSAIWDSKALEDWKKVKDTPRPDVSTGSPVVDAILAGVITAPFAGVTTWPMLAANITGNVGSEIAGRLPGVEGTNAEPWARLGGAVLGGATGVAGWRAGEKAVDLVKAAGAPMKEAGRDQIVGQLLRNKASNADDAIRALEQYNTYTDLGLDAAPGFKLDAGKASRDPNWMAIAELSPNKGALAQSNNAAITAALDRLGAGGDPKKFVAEIAKLDAGASQAAQAALDALPKGVDAGTAGRAIQDALRGRYEALTTARSQAVEPLYEAAKADQTRLKPWPLQVSTADAVAANKGDLQVAAQKVRNLLFDANGKVDRTPAGMMATRKALNDMIGEARPGSEMQRMLMGFRDEVDNALSVVPAEQQARQTYAQMSRPLDVYSADKGNPFNANVIEKDRYNTTFMLPQERVPAMYFRPGDAGAASMKEFLGAQPTPEATNAMRSFIAEKARTAKDVKSFLLQNRPAIEALDPALARQLEDAAATKSISEGFRASPAGKFLNNDLDAAVKQALGAGDSAKRLQALRMTVGSNPEAVSGMQRAIIDDFRRVAEANVANGASRDPMVMANGAAKWLKDNRDSVRNVLTAEQVSALDDIVRNLKDAAQPVPGVRGSQTYDRLATESIIGSLVSQRFADAPVLHPIRKALGLLYGGADEAVKARLLEAIGDPKVAAALAKKATPGNVKLAEPLLRQMLEGATAPARAVQANRTTPGGRE